MLSPKQQIIERFNAITKQASTLFSLDLSNVGLHFDLKGRAAGMACRRGSQYYVRINTDMLKREAFDHLINDTIPHEVAHIVCFMKPSLGNNHDYGWASVCRKLGGSGTRCHSEEVVYGKGVTYEYTTTTGHTVRISERIHKNIMRGSSYTYRGGKGKINATCAHAVVGVAGRTLDTPIVKKAVTTVEHITPAPVTVAPVMVPRAPVVPTFTIGGQGGSKETRARDIMLNGKRTGATYEEMISAIMIANGATRERARSLFSFCSKKFQIVF